jgi:hypothetical protein
MKIFSDISLWWMWLWAIISVAISIWYYRKQKQVEGASLLKKSTLIGLRSLALILLGVLLFGILLETSESKSEKPVFISLIDNSSSMLNYGDSAVVESKIDDFTERLKRKFGERFDFATYYIDDKISSKQEGFGGRVSDLNKGFDYIYNQYYNRNIGGICFISDGNYNAGNSPRYMAEKISLTPIFTVGVGDTLRKSDHMLKSVTANDIAFYKNKFPIDIDIEANKMRGSSAEITLYREGEKVASEKLQYGSGDFDFKHVTFLVDADKIGFVNYVVKLEELDNESSYENNERSIYIEVIDSRSKVLILSEAPHPDIAAIKSVVDLDENIEVQSTSIARWDGVLKDVELLIFHGAGKSMHADLIQKFEEKKIPIFYFITSAASRGNVNQLPIGLRIPGGNRLDEVQSYISDGFSLFQLSDQLIELLKLSPPLKVQFGVTRIQGGSVLLGQRIGPVEKKDPLLYFDRNAAGKFGVFVGEGLWSWKVSEFGRLKNNNGFNELIQKSVQYLIVKRNNDPLRINFPKRFTINDELLLNAEFYNSSLEQITSPQINFTLKDMQGNESPYVFAKNTSDYRLALGRLSAGKYEWNAVTTFNGKQYTKSGVFVVEDVSLEALATSANHNLLKLIAANSNGSFYEIAELNNLIDVIGNRKDIVNISYEETNYNDLIDWKWIAFLLVFLLGLEWGIRRYSGTY